MELSWLDMEHLDERALDGVVALLEAARLVDRPFQPPATVTRHAAMLQHGWYGDPAQAAVVYDARGQVIGYLQVRLPKWDNTHVGEVNVTVDPYRRRQGIGRQLFAAGVDRIRAVDRRVLLASSLDEPAGVAFAQAMGLARASLDVQRRLDLCALDWAPIEREYALARPYAEEYELLRLPGALPEALVAEVATMSTAINDSPTDDLDIEDAVFTPERLQAFEAAQRAQNRRTYRLVARQRRTGVLAGHTMAAVERDLPYYGWQYDTSVVRAHRGHRLGLLLKIDMLRWLSDAEPQLRRLETWNAASNAHMIRVNELLGFTVVTNIVTWQRHLERSTGAT